MAAAVKSKYYDMKFKTDTEFRAWLKEKTKYIVEFEDEGQDFLKWWIDSRGEVLHCEPFHTAIWNGSIVDTGTIFAGSLLGITSRFGTDATQVRYPVKSVEVQHG